jgi:uncharacterized protein with ParB-like and HNH nuclease domain
VKASDAKLLSLLQMSPQFVIPIYQRTYSWDEKQCRQLWDDILRAWSSDDITMHFVVSNIYIGAEILHVKHQSPLPVIDG